MNANPIPVAPAKMSTRFVNHLIDVIVIRIILTAIGFTVGFVLAALGVVDPEFWDDPPAGVILADIVLSLTVFYLYYFLGETCCQKTLGKLVTRTIVLMEDGQRPTPRAVAIRTLSRLCPFEPLSFLGSYPGKWHDSWSGTCVVQLNPGTLGTQMQSGSHIDLDENVGAPYRRPNIAPQPVLAQPIQPTQPLQPSTATPSVVANPQNPYYNPRPRQPWLRKSDINIAICVAICFLVVIVISVISFPSQDPPATCTQPRVETSDQSESSPERLADWMDRIGYQKQATDSLRKIDRVLERGPGRIQSVHEISANTYSVRINARRYLEGDIVNGYTIHDIHPDQVEFHKDGRVFVSAPRR